MDDIANGIKHPVVIDFKIGKITHDPEATIEKITRQKLKYPPVEKIGFQLIGMRVFDNKTGTFSHYDKIFGRSLSEEDLIHGLALYFQFHQTPQLSAIRETIKKFEEIKSVFDRQKTYHFYSSSLIVTYDAYLEDNKNANLNNNNNCSEQNCNINDDDIANNGNCDSAVNLNSSPSSFAQSVRIVMADFAHVFPAKETLDKNYLFGLNSLIEHLKILSRPDYKFKDVRNNRK
jgi:1D-myo-inositol-tetrakisphosphate 5-kinase/inositol-polyphosphate multikinase